MNETIFKLVAPVLALFLLNACQTAAEHMGDVREAEGKDDRVTVGKVQREIRVGMSGATIIQVLGSPNVVTTDEKRREVWIYDKISTTRVYSESRGGISALILGGAIGGGALGGGLGGAGYSSGAGASSTSQRTLTVIVKFDENKLVRDFAYHSSRF
jgi:outer membrane protein assembly factor BamE (lipoprotein component of BamABCDE complex)